MLSKARDKNLQLCFTLTNRKSRRYPAEISDADVLAILGGHLKDATLLLPNIEYVAQVIGLYINAGKTDLICLNQDTLIDIKKI